jgi:hypothetical protein
MEHGARLRDVVVDRRVNTVAGTLNVADAALHLAVAEPNFHERTRLHLRPMQAEGYLIVAIGLARHGQGQVIEDALVQAVHHGGPMGRRQVDASLPFLSAAFLTRYGRYLKLHACPPWRACRQTRSMRQL